MPADLELSSENPRAALKRITMLRAIQVFADDSILRAIHTRLGLEPQAWGYTEGTVDFPAYFHCVCQGKLYIYICGITTEEQGRLIYTSYCRYSGPNGTLVNHSWFDRAATQMYARLNLVARGITDVYLTGYSAGGAICFYLVKNFENPRPLDRNFCITTFGSPRPGPRTLYEGYATAGITRWMNSDDPVCLIPPRRTTWSAWTGYINTPTENLWAQYAQPPGGISVSISGEATPSALPTQIPAPPSAAIGEWLRAVSNGFENSHSLSVYEARLTLVERAWAPNQPALNRDTHADSVGGADAVGGGGGGNADIVLRQPPLPRPIVNQLVNLGHQQNAQPPHIPSERHFRYEKQGGVWVVLFGGYIVATGPSRRHCQSMAQIGILFLARMQTSAVVDVETLRTMFNSYLNFASDPDSGFVPQLNTTYPQ